MRMFRLLRGLVFGGLAASAPSSLVCNTQAAAPGVAEANTAFACDLYGGLKDGQGNLFFSPYSVSTCLGMTYAGARGETEKQMARVLHFSGNAAETHAALGHLQREVAGAGTGPGLQLRIANGLWAQAGQPFRAEFLKVAQGDYQARLEQADFKTGAEVARKTINWWVAAQTEERILDLLPAGSVGASTRMVLANAIYFKGAWAKPYAKNETTVQPFHRETGGQAEAPLMHHFDEVGYMENGDLQAVELPYRGGQLSMVVLLPRQASGCGRLESQLTPGFIAQSLASMKRQRVELFLPRFKLEFQSELKAALTRLGMSDAFSPRSDFSGMDGSRLLYVSGVYHKAWVEVSEEGTEAAAATGLVVNMRAMARPIAAPPVFRADHPFVFFIREGQSGSILFLGRLADPGK